MLSPRAHAAAAACLLVFGTVLSLLQATADATDTSTRPAASAGDPERGLELLLGKAFLPADFPEAAFDEVWRVWPRPLREAARSAAPAERRQMALARYGLPARVDDPQLPLGYVRDGRGGWSLSCLACHAGTLDGQAVLGLGNAQLAFETLSHEVVRARLLEGETLSPWEWSRVTTPLGGTRGTTNAQVFSTYLVAMRDDDLGLVGDYRPPEVLHHDLDAPPLWNTRRKRRLYIDGFAPKSPRTIMQFVLYPQNDAATLAGYEEDFVHILAWIESLRPPEYPGPVDAARAARGRRVFDRACAECHGTYGPGGRYPERTVPIDVVGTDRRRLDGLSPEHRRRFGRGWLGYHGGQHAIAEPAGYVAPPLDGLWASAPYFHNGSVPTVWHVLHPAARPTVWRRSGSGYDRQRLGLEITAHDDLPAEADSAAARREYFDVRASGKSAAGHDFPAELDETERAELLEYLKTL